MKTLIFVTSVIILVSCGPIAPVNTTSNAGGTTNTTSSSAIINTTVEGNSNGKNLQVQRNYTYYKKNSLASPLLSRTELDGKKLFTDLNEALKEPENVFRIQLDGIESGLDLLKLTPRIGELYNLQEVKFNGMYESVPKEIGKLTQIQFCEIRMYNLKEEFPAEVANWRNIQNLLIENNYSSANVNSGNLNWEWIGELENLKDLRFEGKEIKNIPQSISKLKRLEYLNLYNLEKITEIPNLTSAPNLREITIHKLLNLNNLPTEIGNPEKLYQLNLIQCPKLEEFNSSISNYSLLEILVDNCPKITKAPSGFDRFVKTATGFRTSKNNVVFVKNVKKEYSLEKNEIEFYEYYNKYKVSVSLKDAIRTKNKKLVQSIFLDISAKNSDSIAQFLNEISKYENLNALHVIFTNESKFSKILNVAPKIKNLSFSYLGEYKRNQTQIDYLSYSNFMNSFQDIENLYFESVLPKMIETNFRFSQLKTLYIQGVRFSEEDLNVDLSKILNSNPNIENLHLNICTNYIPNQIYSLNKLKTVEISVWEPKQNYKCVIPKEIANLQQLEKFSLLVNDFEGPISHSIDPAINSLKNLKVLEITFGFDAKKSQIINYPAGIENLTNLEKLIISPINSTPKGVDKLNLKIPFNQYK